jgi:hypothetical protein
LSEACHFIRSIVQGSTVLAEDEHQLV